MGGIGLEHRAWQIAASLPDYSVSLSLSFTVYPLSFYSIVQVYFMGAPVKTNAFKMVESRTPMILRFHFNMKNVIMHWHFNTRDSYCIMLLSVRQYVLVKTKCSSKQLKASCSTNCKLMQIHTKLMWKFVPEDNILHCKDVAVVLYR